MAIRIANLGSRYIPPLDVSFTDSTYDTVDRTEYTFTMSLGTATSDRCILAAIYGSGPGTRYSEYVSIAGIDCSDWMEGTTTGTNNGWAGLYLAHVPTGTSGDIYSLWNGALGPGCSAGLWAIYGLRNYYFLDKQIDEGATSDYNELYISAVTDSLTFATLGTLDGGSVNWTTGGDWTDCSADFSMVYSSSNAGHHGAWRWEENPATIDMISYSAAIDTNRGCLVAVNLA